MSAGRMTDSENAVHVERVLRGDRPERGGAGGHIVERPGPCAAGISNAAIFEAPRGQSRLVQRDAQMADVIEVVRGPPEAAMNHDDDGVRTRTIGEPQFAELQRIAAVRNAFSRSFGRPLEDVLRHGWLKHRQRKGRRKEEKAKGKTQLSLASP